jgi:hypothetical protein
MRLATSAVVFAIATSTVAAAETWECSYPNHNSSWTIDGDMLITTYTGPPVVIGGQAVDINTLFNNVSRIITNEQHGLIAIQTLVHETPAGEVSVHTETLLLNKQTGDSRIVWSSTIPSDGRLPVYGKCRKSS